MTTPVLLPLMRVFKCNELFMHLMKANLKKERKCGKRGVKKGLLKMRKTCWSEDDAKILQV